MAVRVDAALSAVLNAPERRMLYLMCTVDDFMAALLVNLLRPNRQLLA